MRLICQVEERGRTKDEEVLLRTWPATSEHLLWPSYLVSRSTSRESCSQEMLGDMSCSQQKMRLIQMLYCLLVFCCTVSETLHLPLVLLGRWVTRLPKMTLDRSAHGDSDYSRPQTDTFNQRLHLDSSYCRGIICSRRHTWL